MRLIAVIIDSPEVRKILCHLVKIRRAPFPRRAHLYVQAIARTVIVRCLDPRILDYRAVFPSVRDCAMPQGTLADRVQLMVVAPAVTIGFVDPPPMVFTKRYQTCTCPAPAELRDLMLLPTITSPAGTGQSQS
jgi:hypothetical protein